MADTIRTLADLQGILADNSPAKQISAQDLRDFLISVTSNRFLNEQNVNYSATDDDIFIAMDTTAGNRTVTLPALQLHKKFYIKKADATENTLTIQPSGGTLIDGDANAVIGAPYGVLCVIGGSTVWHLY